MLKLELPSTDTKNDYKNKFLPLIIKRVKGELKGRRLSDKAKDILLPGWDTATPDTSILVQLLTAEPEELKRKNDDLWSKLQALPCRKRPDKKTLNEVFDYEHLIDKSKSNSYWLAGKVGRNTCAYCNRTYTLTVVKGEGKNDGERIVRPTFDHWYAHADYPLMSMSLCNLIPSCSICNSSVKTTAPFDLNTHVHPYVHELGHPKLNFEATLITGNPAKWSVEIKTDPGSKEEKTVADLKLNEIYAYHGELEVKDLMDFKSKYPNDYLKDLVEKILKDNCGALSFSDVYRMLFGTEINEVAFLDRPLSKMKYDLLKGMGVI